MVLMLMLLAMNGVNNKIKRVDEISPVEIAEDFDTLTLEKNKMIDIVTENQITVPSNNGHYIYEVMGKWDDGEAAYVFDVEIN